MNLSPLKIKVVSLAKDLFGNRVVANLMNKRYIDNYKQHKIIFIHIPKAAGTSISGLLYGKRNGHLKAAYVKDQLGVLYSEKFSFSVSRNPYDRLVSAYNFARQGETKHGAIANPEFYKKSEFDSFESFIKNWLVRQDLNSLDPVFQPQHLFVFQNNNCLVNEIYQLDNMEKLEYKLSEILHKEIHFKKKNQSTYQDKIAYNQELKDIVYKLYQKDFELLGYER